MITLCHIQPNEKAEEASSPDGAEQLGKCVLATLSIMKVL